MRYYRRGVHQRKAESLTVDNVLCSVLPNGHLSANGRYLCYHNLTIRIPDMPDASKGVAMLTLPESHATTWAMEDLGNGRSISRGFGGCATCDGGGCGDCA